MILPTLLMLSLAAEPVCLVVDSGQITAADLGTRIQAFRALPATTVFSAAPTFGVQRELSAPLLSQWATMHGIDAAQIEPLCVFRRTVQNEDIQWESEVREALDSLFQFQPGPGELVIHDTHLASGPPGILSLDRSGLTYETQTRRYLWRGKVTRDGQYAAARIHFSIQHTEQRLITARPLPAGRMLRPEDFTWDSFPVRPELPAVDKLSTLPEHQVLRRSLPKGVILLPQHLMDAPLIFPGDPVELLSKAGQATIRLQGIAKGKARMGDPILIATLEGNRLLRAIAVGPGRAEIESATGRKPK